MNHFDRLMQRALALPRSAGAALFDPFEQVASAERMEAPSPYTPATHARPVTPDGVERNLPGAMPTAPQPPKSLPATDARAALPQPPRATQAGTAPVPVERTASLPQAAPLRPEAAAPRPLDALARADRFMRELGMPGATRSAVPSIAPSADPVTADAPPGDRPPSNARAHAALRHTPPDAAGPALRPRLEPVAPVPLSEPAHRPPAARTHPARATEAVAPVAAHKPAPTVVPPATTVLVQAASRSPWASDLERLGRDTPMARFGVGQW